MEPKHISEFLPAALGASLKTYKVRLEYHSIFHETVEAKSQDDAITKVRDENWNVICLNMSAYSEDATEQ